MSEFFDISDDYINRKEVLEYVLKRVLVDMPPLKSLPEPQEVRDMVDTYKKSNDPLERFMEEMALPDEDGNIQLAWDLVPFTFLFDLYRAWYEKKENSCFSLGQYKFTQEVRILTEKHPDYWEATVDKKGKVTQRRTGQMMSKPEPLILEYCLEDWTNPKYNGKDPDKVCLPVIKEKYSGIVRKPVNQNP